MMPTEGLGDAPSRAAKAKSPGERAEDTDLRCEDGVCAAFTGLGGRGSQPAVSSIVKRNTEDG